MAFLLQIQTFYDTIKQRYVWAAFSIPFWLLLIIIVVLSMSTPNDRPISFHKRTGEAELGVYLGQGAYAQIVISLPLPQSSIKEIRVIRHGTLTRGTACDLGLANSSICRILSSHQLSSILAYNIFDIC